MAIIRSRLETPGRDNNGSPPTYDWRMDLRASLIPQARLPVDLCVFGGCRCRGYYLNYCYLVQKMRNYNFLIPPARPLSLCPVLAERISVQRCSKSHAHDGSLTERELFAFSSCKGYHRPLGSRRGKSDPSLSLGGKRERERERATEQFSCSIEDCNFPPLELDPIFIH